jgi:hypothetical protein
MKRLFFAALVSLASTFVGTCFGNASGALTGNVAIATRVGPTPGYGVTDCYTGWNNQLFSLEEVY